MARGVLAIAISSSPPEPRDESRPHFTPKRQRHGSSPPSARFRCVGDFQTVRQLTAKTSPVKAHSSVVSSARCSATQQGGQSRSPRGTAQGIKYSLAGEAHLSDARGVSRMQLTTAQRSDTVKNGVGVTADKQPSFLKRQGRARARPKSAEFILDSDRSEEEMEDKTENTTKQEQPPPASKPLHSTERGTSIYFNAPEPNNTATAKPIDIDRPPKMVENGVEDDEDMDQGAFAHLVGNFAYPAEQGASRPDPTHVAAGREGQKRRRTATDVRPETRKAPKKALTITALATAAYRQAPLPTQKSILSVMEPKEDEKPKRKPRAKPSKKAKVVEQIVLPSPSQAQHELSRQTYIFGTSSQLGGDESPTTITQIQLALQESEFGPERSSPVAEQSYRIVPTAPHGTSLSVGPSGRDLWSVAARDFGGGLLKGDSQVSRTDSLIDAREDLHAPVPSAIDCVPSPESAVGEMDLPDLDLPESTRQDHVGTAIGEVPRASKEPIVISSDSAEPGTTSPQLVVLQSVATSLSRIAVAEPAQRTSRSILQPLDANLPVKKGKRLISSQAKDDKNEGKSPSHSPARQFSQHLDDISDCETSAPSLRPLQQLKETDSQWPPVLAKLFPEISAKIQALPPSNSLTHPSWHEKILLYDPIVIEDLTAWLNEQGMSVSVTRLIPKNRKKQESTEVCREPLAHWMVQKWCEQHSVCCLWKSGMRGGVRTRY